MGVPFYQLLLNVFKFCFRLLKIGLYNLYSKDLAIGTILLDLTMGGKSLFYAKSTQIYWETCPQKSFALALKLEQHQPLI